MTRSKYEIINELISIKDNIFIGDIKDISKETFNTDNLYISQIMLPLSLKNSQQYSWQNSKEKYIFEKKNDTYIEIFTGLVLTKLNFKKEDNLNQKFIFFPIPYNTYIKRNNSEEELRKKLSIFETEDDEYIDKAIKVLQKIKTSNKIKRQIN